MKISSTSLFCIETVFICALLLSAPFALAQTSDGVQGYITAILRFINWTLIPLIFSFALLFFLVNVARFFILGGGDTESQEKAKSLALYGIGAFVLLVSIWGIVNIFIGGFGIGRENSLCPDYVEDCYESNTIFRASFRLNAGMQ